LNLAHAGLLFCDSGLRRIAKVDTTSISIELKAAVYNTTVTKNGPFGIDQDMVYFFCCDTIIGEPWQSMYCLPLKQGSGNSESCTRAKA